MSSGGLTWADVDDDDWSSASSPRDTTGSLQISLDKHVFIH